MARKKFTKEVETAGGLTGLAAIPTGSLVKTNGGQPAAAVAGSDFVTPAGQTIVHAADYVATTNPYEVNYVFTGLNGDADGEYILEFDILTASNQVILLPNDGNSNPLHTFRVTGSGASAGSSTKTDGWYLAQNGNASKTQVSGRAIIHARTGFNRYFQSVAIFCTSVPALSQLEINAGMWYDTSHNITSLSVMCSAILPGSKLTLFKIARP